MTNTDEIWGEPGVPRDRWQRPLIVPPGGGKPVAYTRCTTFAGSVEDTFNLSQWQQRMVALGLAERPDLMVSVAAHYDDKSELNKICQIAIEAAKGKAAAGVGTALHKLTDRLDRGEPLGPVPAEYQPDLDAFAAATAVLKPLALERFVVQDDMKIGGTFDRLYEFEGKRYIGDTKSGSIEWGSGKIAMQLAIYSRSLMYDVKTKERTPLNVEQDKAIVVHLPAGQGRCELKWVDISAGWTAVQLAADVRKWRSRKGLIFDLKPASASVLAPAKPKPVPLTNEEIAQLSIPHDEGCTCAGCDTPMGPTLTEVFGPTAEPSLNERISGATTEDALTQLWLENQTSWTNEHTAAAKKRKLQLHQLVLRSVDTLSA